MMVWFLEFFAENRLRKKINLGVSLENQKKYPLNKIVHALLIAPVYKQNIYPTRRHSHISLHRVLNSHCFCVSTSVRDFYEPDFKGSIKEKDTTNVIVSLCSNERFTIEMRSCGTYTLFVPKLFTRYVSLDFSSCVFANFFHPSQE